MQGKKLRITFLFFSFFALLFFSSCVTNRNFFNQVDSHVGRGDYQTAVSMIEKNEDNLYTKKDLVLKSLDKGLLLHYGGDYKTSNKELAYAEEKMFEYFSKSISQSVQSFIINDAVIDYAGDPYEDIYSNLFMALNYIALNEIDKALVEIRRFDTKQKNLRLNYAQAQNKANQNSLSDAYFGEMSFHNSALARYLSMLLYRAEGNVDAAEIDLRYIKTAFRDQSQLYPFSLPSSLDDELIKLPGLERLNVLCFTGLAPIKTEEVIRFYTSDTYYKLALPLMFKRPSRIVSISVAVENEDTGEKHQFRLDPLESIDSIAYDTFRQKQDLLYFKAIARSIAKSMTTNVLDAASRVDQNGDASGILGLLSIVSLVSNELTEVADLRTSRYFPAKASVGGIHLAPGRYTVQIQYKDAWGGTIWLETIQGFELKRNTINLVEGICLQ